MNTFYLTLLTILFFVVFYIIGRLINKGDRFFNDSNDVFSIALNIIIGFAIGGVVGVIFFSIFDVLRLILII